MNRYEILERLGDGTFGEVLKAKSLKTNEIVAIKKLKGIFHTWEECLQLRELKSLKQLRHENIIQLKEVVREKEELYFVFEYMKSSLCHLMRPKTARGVGQMGLMEDKTLVNGEAPIAGACGDALSGAGAETTRPMLFTEAQIRSVLFQLFSGLAHMHKHGYFHRDIKPENLLCHEDTLKIADLGQAREIRSCPPFTEYVATRWYRSPELLLHATTYNSPIDLWAAGCIMAELYYQAPLFPGSSEADQMCRICRVLGTPTKESWPDGMTLVSKMQFKFPKCSPIPLKSLFPQASSAAIQLITELLQYDPSRRPTASQALQHRYFAQGITRPVLVSVATDRQPMDNEVDYNESIGSTSSSTNSYAVGLPANRSSSSYGLLPAKAEMKMPNYGVDSVKQQPPRMLSMTTVLDMDQDIKELKRVASRCHDDNEKSCKPTVLQEVRHHHHHHHNHKSVGTIDGLDALDSPDPIECSEPRDFSPATSQDAVTIAPRADSKRGTRRHHTRRPSFKTKKAPDQEDATACDKSNSARTISTETRQEPQSQETLLQDLLDEFFA